MHAHARLDLNVQVMVQNSITGKIVQSNRFKNTATRLLTDSLCKYLMQTNPTGSIGAGKPNYIGLGTMGILQQGNNESPITEPQFSDTNPNPFERTRPWFESTSLGLTNLCGNNDASDFDYRHFWNPEYGWGTPDNPDVPCFQGELCTANSDYIIRRLPILRSDIYTTPPDRLDYGLDGCSSGVVFYTYASVEWVRQFLNPPNGPTLDRIAISEFGLYEKNNTDPGGLYTLLAGFRVPTESDIVYLSKDDVLVISWRVTVRALMPFEEVQEATVMRPYGISISGNILSTTTVQFQGTVRSESPINSELEWSVTNQEHTDTYITNQGLLHISEGEQSTVLYVRCSLTSYPDIYTDVNVFTGLLHDQITGVLLSYESVSETELQYSATVIGRGDFSQQVTWSVAGNSSPDTQIDQTGLLQIDPNESGQFLEITATSVQDTQVSGTDTITFGPSVIEFETNLITQVSNLTKTFGRLAAKSLGTPKSVTGALTVGYLANSSGTGVISVRVDGEVLQTYSLIFIGGQSGLRTLNFTYELPTTRTRFSIDFQGPGTITSAFAVISGTSISADNWFDSTTDYYAVGDILGAYWGTSKHPGVYIDIDNPVFVPTTFGDENSNLESVAIPEGITDIE